MERKLLLPNVFPTGCDWPLSIYHIYIIVLQPRPMTDLSIQATDGVETAALAPLLRGSPMFANALGLSCLVFQGRSMLNHRI